MVTLDDRLRSPTFPSSLSNLKSLTLDHAGGQPLRVPFSSEASAYIQPFSGRRVVVEVLGGGDGERALPSRRLPTALNWPAWVLQPVVVRRRPEISTNC